MMQCFYQWGSSRSDADFRASEKFSRSFAQTRLLLPKFDEFIGLCLQGVGGQDAQCVATSVQGFHFLPLLRRSFLFFFKLMPPIQSFAPVWNNFFYFLFLFGSVTSTAVSQSRWWHKDFRLLSQTKSKLCVFMCEAHTHEGTWLHDWFMRWLEHSLLNKCVWVCHQRCSVNEHKSMFVSVISVSG